MNYKSGYYFLFNALTDAIEILKRKKDTDEIINILEQMQRSSEEIVIKE